MAPNGGGDDPVAAEIEALKRALLGGVDAYREASEGVIDAALDLARAARSSRPTMAAVRPERPTGVRRRAHTPLSAAEADVTSRFDALRARR